MPSARNGWLVIFCGLVVIMLGNNSAAPICMYGGKMNPAGECECPAFNNCTESLGVCGSNAIEYRNECELNWTACFHQRHLVVFKKGMCGQSIGVGGQCSYFHCSLPCQYGFIQDNFGCFSKCECRGHQCDTMSSCNSTCDGQGGVVLDENNCPKCQCRD